MGKGDATHLNPWRMYSHQCVGLVVLPSWHAIFLHHDKVLGFEFCVFVAGWRHAFRSEWPFTIFIITI